jgi:hypothetical protein
MFPFSIVIVIADVGQADFQAIDALDADDHPLISS